MNTFKKSLVTLIAVLTFGAVLSGVAFAGLVSGTSDLYYDGGQTGTYVYSGIEDTNLTNSTKWSVKAIVRVCGAEKADGFHNDSAYVSEPRTLWCNETSHYDYRSR